MNWIPHGYCLMWNWWIIALLIAGDLVVASAYMAISIELYRSLTRARVTIAEAGKDVVLDFAIFIIACGLGHLFTIVLFWVNWYVFSGSWTLLVTGVFSWRAYFRIRGMNDKIASLVFEPCRLDEMDQTNANMNARIDKLEENK